MSDYKACTVCKQIKAHSEFNKNKRLKSGLASECRSCKSLYDASYRERNKEKIAANHKRWSVKNKDHILAKNIAWRQANPERYKEAQKKSAAKHKDKKLAYNQWWRQNNIERQRKATAEWQKRNPESKRRSANKRRARILGSDYELYTEQDVLQKYGLDCHICKKPIDLTAPRRVGRPGWENGLHIEHLIPIDKNGPDTLANVRPSHGLCNLRKGPR